MSTRDAKQKWLLDRVNRAIPGKMQVLATKALRIKTELDELKRESDLIKEELKRRDEIIALRRSRLSDIQAAYKASEIAKDEAIRFLRSALFPDGEVYDDSDKLETDPKDLIWQPPICSQ